MNALDRGAPRMAEQAVETPTIRSFSQYGEDAVILNFFYLHSRLRNGFYVDIGAFDPVQYSNTYHLHRRGWRGINIDIVADRIKKFAAVRPEDNNVLAAIGDEEGELEVFGHPQWASMTTVDKTFAANIQSYSMGMLKSRTLENILREFNVKHIDYMNIDVEGFEMKVLSSLDPSKYGISLFTVELLTQDINVILNSDLYKYMTLNGYVFCGWTGWTLFFRSPSLAL
jgi:FkbM family methyltransferase